MQVKLNTYMSDETKRLIPFTQQTASEYGKLGQKASIQARRQKKLMKDIILEMFEYKATSKMRQELKRKFPGMSNYIDEINIQQAMTLSMIDQAVHKGNIKAYEALRDTAGQKPVDKVANTDPSGEQEAMTITFVTGGIKSIQTNTIPGEIIDESQDNTLPISK